MKNKIKVRIEVSPLADKQMSGVGNYTQLLADALSVDSNFETEPVFFNFLDRQVEPIITNNKAKKNKLVPLKIYAKLSSFGRAPYWDTFKKPVDLTIFTNFDTWPTVKSKYVATTVHDLTYLYHPEVVELKNLEHLRRVVPKTLKKADLILTVSNAVKDEIIKEFGVDKNKIVVTHVPPDKSFSIKKSSSEISKALKKYHIDSKYIYFIGNFEPRKNLSTLISAYKLLPYEIKSQYGLVLAGGKGWNYRETEKLLVDTQNEGENIKYIGYIDQKDSPALYQGASLFVMASVYEGFGIPILEAMESKVPVVASDIPVLRETASNAAMFFECKDSRSLANAIEKVISDKKLQNELVKLGSKNLHRFSWQKNIASIKEAISNLDKSK